MKLLFDENLSRRLAPRLTDLFPDSKHVSDLDLLHARDAAIWEFARQNDFVLVSADATTQRLLPKSCCAVNRFELRTS